MSSPENSAAMNTKSGGQSPLTSFEGESDGAAATPPTTGFIGFFQEAGQLLEAAKKAEGAPGFCSFETYSPYPVHGMDQVQKLPRSILPYVTFAAGLTGGSLGFLLQYWTSVVDWPINTGGKPLNSWEAFVPVTFELTILFAGLTTVGAMFFLNGLPNLGQKALDPRLTQDRFALVIHALTGREEEVLGFLKSLGALEVRTTQTEGWFS